MSAEHPAAKGLPEHSPPERFGPFPPMRESDDVTPGRATDADASDEGLVPLCVRAEREPLDVDVSDFSDEWCAGFLAGQVNALEVLIRKGYE